MTFRILTSCGFKRGLLFLIPDVMITQFNYCSILSNPLLVKCDAMDTAGVFFWHGQHVLWNACSIRSFQGKVMEGVQLLLLLILCMLYRHIIDVQIQYTAMSFTTTWEGGVVSCCVYCFVLNKRAMRAGEQQPESWCLVHLTIYCTVYCWLLDAISCSQKKSEWKMRLWQAIAMQK